VITLLQHAHQEIRGAIQGRKGGKGGAPWFTIKGNFQTRGMHPPCLRVLMQGVPGEKKIGRKGKKNTTGINKDVSYFDKQAQGRNGVLGKLEAGV